MKSNRPVVLVTGVSGDAGQGIIAGLKQATSQPYIIGLDYTDDNAGFAMCDLGIQVPGIAAENYISSLLNLVTEHSAKLLFPGIDGEQLLLAEAAPRFAELGCTLIGCDPDFIRIASDKIATSEWLLENDLGAPESWPASTPIAELVPRLPLIIKPRAGHGSQGVYVVRTAEDLQNRVLEQPDACVQDYIDGPEYTCSLLFDDQGNLCDWLVTQRELSGGRTIRTDVVDEPVIVQYLHDFAQRAKGVRGSVNLQLRTNGDGKVKVFEINPRHSGSTSMRVAVGYNEPARLLEYHVHGTPMGRAEVTQARVYRVWSQIVVPRSPK